MKISKWLTIIRMASEVILIIKAYMEDMEEQEDEEK